MRKELNIFLDYQKVKGLSLRTIARYEGELHSFLEYVRSRGAKETSQIKEEDIVSYYQKLKKENLSSHTIHSKMRVIHQYLRFLKERGLLLTNPAQALEIPKRGDMTPRNILTEEEVKGIMQLPSTERTTGIRDRAILELLYYTAIRRRELINLDVYDINLKEKLLTIREGKGRKDRILPLGRLALHWLSRYLKEVRPRWTEKAQTPALFLSQEGNRINPPLLEELFHRINKTSRKRVSPHILRHSCAVHLLRGGASIRYVQELLGHEWIGTTQIYTRLTNPDLRIAYEKSHPRDKMKKV